jgi:site-specific DNA recombinase
MERRRTAPAKQQRHAYLLAGLLVCGACGNRMIGARRASEAAGGGELVYYRCESATNQGRCSFRTRHADALERAVRDELARTEGYPVAARPPPEHLDRGAPRLVALQRDLSRMLERFVAGEWTWAELRRRTAANVLEQLEIEAAHATATVTTIDPDTARRRLLAEWDALPADERRRLLRECIAEVVVADDGVLVTRRR